MLSLLAAATVLPEECLLTGLCWFTRPLPGPPPGVMFLALGLVLAGVVGMRRRERD